MKNKFLTIGSLIVGTMVMISLCAPFLSSYPITYQDLPHQYAEPSSKHLLGQDEYGSDIFTHLIYGARLSLYISIITTFLCCFIGLIIGSISAYYGGKLDTLIMRIVDIFLAFPGILLAIGIAAILERSANNVILALTLTGWTGYARLTRGQILSLKEKEYVLGAHALGLSTLRIVSRYLWPNLFSSLLVQASFGMAGVIIAESSLSFLGLGAGGQIASWGSMIDQARRHIQDITRIHLLLPPLFAIMLTVLGFNFLGDGLLRKWDAKLVGRKYGL